jgi:hypothetical protein
MKECPKGQKKVLCRYIVRKGKHIYPKNARVFHFFVKGKTERRRSS